VEENQTHLVDLGERLDLGPVQDPQRQADHLQVLGPRRRRDIPRLCADVKDDVSLQPWNEKVRAFVDHVIKPGISNMSAHVSEERTLRLSLTLPAFCRR